MSRNPVTYTRIWFHWPRVWHLEKKNLLKLFKCVAILRLLHQQTVKKQGENAFRNGLLYNGCNSVSTMHPKQSPSPGFNPQHHINGCGGTHLLSRAPTVKEDQRLKAILLLENTLKTDHSALWMHTWRGLWRTSLRCPSSPLNTFLLK